MVIFIITASVSAQPTASKPSAVTVIHAGTLIDGTSSAPRRDQAIVVRGQRIERVGPWCAAAVPAGATVIDLSGADRPSGNDRRPHAPPPRSRRRTTTTCNILKESVAFRAARATALAGRMLEQGFTTIRDVETEGAGYADVGVKQAIEKGYVAGPRMFVCTRAISSTGGYSPRRLLAGPRPAQGRAARGRPGRGAQGRARAALERRRLDQGLHEPPLLGRRERQSRLAADADARTSSRRSSTRRTARDERSPATPTTGSACAGRSTAGATRSSTAST